MVYGVYPDVSYKEEEKEPEYYCHPTLYKFLFWFFTIFRIPRNYAAHSVKGNERAFLTYFYQTSPLNAVKDAISNTGVNYYMKYFGQPARFSASLGF